MPRLSGAERRSQLLVAAREEFSRAGPEGARIQAIAARAGVNVALIYRHFESKDQLFEEAIVEPLDRLLHELSAVTASLDPSVRIAELVETSYRTLLTTFDQTAHLFGVVLFSDRDKGREFYRRRIAPFVDTVAARMRSAGPDWPQRFDPAVTTPMCVGMCWGVVTDAHARGVDVDVDTIAASLTQITLAGLAPPE